MCLIILLLIAVTIADECTTYTPLFAKYGPHNNQSIYGPFIYYAVLDQVDDPNMMFDSKDAASNLIQYNNTCRERYDQSICSGISDTFISDLCILGNTDNDCILSLYVGGNMVLSQQTWLYQNPTLNEKIKVYGYDKLERAYNAIYSRCNKNMIPPLKQLIDRINKQTINNIPSNTIIPQSINDYRIIYIIGTITVLIAITVGIITILIRYVNNKSNSHEYEPIEIYNTV